MSDNAPGAAPPPIEGSGGSMESYNEVPIPVDGEAIQVRDDKFAIPDNPIIPFIEGDGTGPDIWRAARTVFDAAVLEAYGGRRRVAWYEEIGRAHV